MHSAIYHGWVRHRRFAPRGHAFSYQLYMMYLDLAELGEVFRSRWLWSTHRFALARFDRSEHLGPSDVPLDQAVRDLVAQHTGLRPCGPIRLLTHLRYFGYAFNPVSFYYCFDAADTRVDTIVAEVNNTPWGEQHCYVLDESRNEGRQEQKRYRFAKDFHVSPFMPMDLSYDWRFSSPGRELALHMQLLRPHKIFDATMHLQHSPITGLQLAKVLIGFPLMTVKVIAAIYWEALRLWLKGIPTHPHPTPSE